MAVYKRSYRAYSGETTPAWSRFLVLYRFSRRNLSHSKIQTVFFVICLFFPLLCLLGIYANSHLNALTFLSQSTGPFLDVNGRFFSVYLDVQAAFAFLLTAFIGPGLISPDLANGALTLYLCRPLSRIEYVLGKISVLFITLSWITWLPGLVLFFVQASISGSQWMWNNLWIASAIFLGSFVWITVLSLAALALSAWVRWRIVAGALLLGLFFFGAGFGRAINAVLRTQQGYLIDLSQLVSIVWHDLFRDIGEPPLPVTEAWIALLVFASFCLYLLMRKIRANEVVR